MKNINNYYRAFFLFVISFLYLTVFQNDISGSVDFSTASDLTKIEAVFQPELPKKFQPEKGSSSSIPRRELGFFYLESFFKFRKKILLSINTISKIHLNCQNTNPPPFHHIISILQKNNTWHQSSDEDAFLNDFC
jgi:hypothetical protein